MSNTQTTTNKRPQHIQDLLKRAEEGTRQALRDYFGHTRAETIYKNRRQKEKPDPKKKREKEIADFKTFSANLNMPLKNE
jgi:hypothetical protein